MITHKKWQEEEREDSGTTDWVLAKLQLRRRWDGKRNAPQQTRHSASQQSPAGHRPRGGRGTGREVGGAQGRGRATVT